MSLTTKQRDRIERWVGPIDSTVVKSSAPEQSFEDWIDAYGEPETAALQFLTRRLAQLSIAPTSVGSGSDRAEHVRNLEFTQNRIDDLVSWINSNLADLTLTEEGEDLVEAAASGPTESTIVVDTLVQARRRG